MARGPGAKGRREPSLTTDPKKGLPFVGFSLLLSIQLFHFGSSVSLGAKPAGLFSPSPNLPLQGLSLSVSQRLQQAMALCLEAQTCS